MVCSLIRSAIVAEFSAILPGYKLKSNHRCYKPYHIDCEPFEFYQIVINVPNDLYATFRLYFPITMDYVHCLYFKRIPNRKRRIYQKDQTIIVNIIAESGWDQVEQWLIQHREVINELAY